MSFESLAHSLKKATGLAAIAAASAFVSLPALAGGSASDSAPKPTSSESRPAPTNEAKPIQPQTSESAPTPNEVRPSQSQTSPAAAPQASGGTIVDVAAANRSFKTLTTAVKAAGLTEILSGEGPYTVFAPTDEAFAALPKGTVEMLMKPENKAKLQKVLAYHVLQGAVESSAIKSGSVRTAEGSSVKFDVKGNQVMVNNAKVTSANIKASNGVIHAIDKVILPPDL
ncbi:MAG: fasciclin domain-containing protein [Leptolyngbyaceae cyanobacterium RU_5_1]|nr:fasciclin domain-containing protein [Leptolyngbyaceae cyanobacterium RU_5_1]